MKGISLCNPPGYKALRLFPDKSIDHIIFTDVIEHLEKEEGFQLIQECERIARRQIILFTPLGFLPQKVREDKVDAWGLRGGSFQEHKSGWHISDFDDSWDIYCSEKYHFFDNAGKRFEKPYGAFWAIKNVPGTGEVSCTCLFRYRFNKKRKAFLKFLRKILVGLIPKFLRKMIKAWLNFRIKRE